MLHRKVNTLLPQKREKVSDAANVLVLVIIAEDSEFHVVAEVRTIVWKWWRKIVEKRLKKAVSFLFFANSLYFCISIEIAAAKLTKKSAKIKEKQQKPL